MPNLPLDPSSSAGNLREYLAGILPDSQVTEAAVQTGYQPLVLFETKHVMAAFAFSNGDMGKSYEALYGSFKSYYTQQRNRWDALDLAFVFCVPADVPNLDRFCSHVETDVYFCRKFVVPLAEPLNHSLARLPFLPLSPLQGHSLRPPSAQTFLQQAGVPAVLAKYLVVQRERSADGIVEDCTSGTLGKPSELNPRSNKRVPHVDRVGSPVRLGSVSIKNFRAYRRSQTFQLGADVTVLYGPNGFGKTSFFDAIDFAVTGDIGRMRSSGDVHFRKTAKHLDSGTEESTVSLSFSSDGGVRRLTRKVSNRKYATLDGRETDRKTILADLTGGEFPAADRVENFVSLFRATHLFSQEHQELAKDFQNDCELSEQIVSRLLAFEDYTNAANKTSRVRELLEKEIEKADTDVEELSQQNVGEQAELDQLAHTAGAHPSVEALEDAVDALRDRLLAAGLAAESEAYDVHTIRSWRTTLEAQHAQKQREVDRLSALAKDATRFPHLLARFDTLRNNIREKESSLASATKQVAVAEQAARDADKALAEITRKRDQALAERTSLLAVRTIVPIYRDLIDREHAAEKHLADSLAVLVDHQESQTKLIGETKAKETLLAQLSSQLTDRNAALARVQQLRAAFPKWQADSAQRTKLTEAGLGAQKTFESLAAEERRLTAQLDSLMRDETRLSKQIAQVDKTQSGLRQLLSQLQQHVRGGTCPLCGDDHGSKEALLKRISEQVAADAASDARTELASVKDRIGQISSQLSTTKQATASEEAVQAESKRALIALNEAIASFETSLAEVGVRFPPSDPQTILQQVQELEDQLDTEVSGLSERVSQLTAEADAARTAVANVTRSAEQAAADVASKRSALATIQTELKRLRDDRRFANISLDIQAEALADIEKRNANNLGAVETELKDAQLGAGRAQSSLASAREESRSVTAELTRRREEAADIEKQVTQIGARLEEAGLPANSDDKYLLNLVAGTTRAQAHFLELRDSAASLEVAIDAASTAAALSRLRQNIVNREKAITAARARRAECVPWLDYFSTLLRLITAQQNDAIGHFTSQYGPRTAVIQRRLRAVYGFDDVEIQSHKSGIRVRVRRRGEELKPTDYFSQSQQQTLLLGLFLTACLSQTWSALSPVFLDDPVTHFDDLNTYAFLDLIVGLLESDAGRRQFVISTCDEKFLQLARQKFRHLGARAKFYTFSAIGANGPVVEEIASSDSHISDGDTAH